MTDHEKVMSWLEGLTDIDWRAYHSDSEVRSIAKAALELLKEREPRVLTLEEALVDNNNSIEISPYVFVEVKGRNDIFIGSVHDDIYGGYHSNDIKVRVYRIWMSDSKTYSKADYMKTVRFWNRKPTYEQRQAVTWND